MSDRIVVGTLTGLEPRNAGWFRFTIMEPNKQYPVKADTKKPEIVAAGQALMGTYVSAEIAESQSDQINPHNGQPYTNRYLNALAPATPGAASTQYAPPVYQAQAAPQTMQAPAPVQTYVPTVQTPPMAPPVQVNEQTRELRIMRQTGVKAAAEIISSRPDMEVSLESIVTISEGILAYLVYGPARFGVVAFDQNPAPAATVQQAVAPAAAQGDPTQRPVFDENGNPVLDESGLPAGY